jgi:sec-independent protein translocase protein TatC
MTLFDHLDELRKRIFVAVAAWVVASGVMFGFRFEVIEWLKRPLPPNMVLSYFSLLEPFSTSMQVAAFFGLVLAAPVVVAQIWGFLSPGLYEDERRYAVPFILFAAAAFAIGVAFAYYVVLPITVPILLGFLGEAATGLLSIGRYIGNLLMLMGVFGLMFELPVLAFLLARIGVVRAPMLIRTRRYAVVILLVLAAAMSPSGDPFNFALVAIPLLVLYEISILVVRIAQRGEGSAVAEPDAV